MKRKLDENDVPQAVDEPAPKLSQTFAEFGLDSRLLQAVTKEGWAIPTAVQQAGIPISIEGKDVLARAKTGSGKTAAYLLPVIHSILRRKSIDPGSRKTSALILVPTRELAEQVSKAIARLSAFCSSEVSIVNLAQKISDAVQRSSLVLFPDIVVTTPARAALNINTATLSLDNVAHVVIDEADLVLSYGYEEDLRIIQKALPTGAQVFLMSATLSTEVDSLKAMFCKDPVILVLDEEEAKEKNGVTQYVVKCAEDEKFLLAYVIFKMKLVKGKTIIFVGDIDRSYRLKLFFEQFGIKSCVLNSELPINSRLHVVEEFNKNVYDLLIASDEQEALGNEGSSRKSKRSKKSSDAADETAAQEFDDMELPVSENGTGGERQAKKKTRRKAKTDKEYGISRGIDFQNVTTIFNFDFPTTATSYTHRIGRTARAGQNGMALSFVIPSDQYRKHKPTSFPTTQHDEKILAQIAEEQEALGKELKPYHFDMSQVDAFRYRMNDALRAVTQVAIREARTRELRQELLKSEKLKRHFEENPDDLRHLRHDGELRAARIQQHLKHVPDYLMPRNGTEGIVVKDAGFVGIGKVEQNRIRKARAFNKARGKGKKTGKSLDPLKTFNAKGRK